MLLAPAMRAWVHSTKSTLMALPHPADAPTAHSPGSGSCRILIFGTGPAVGWGVLSHELALPGSLARVLSAHTGRGVDADVIVRPLLTAGAALKTIPDTELSRYDAIVVILGVTDARRLTSRRTWRRNMRALSDLLIQSSSPATEIFLVGIPPIRSIPNYDNFPGGIAARHAESLNRVTKRVSKTLPRTHFVPLPATSVTPPHRHRDPAAYRRWAEIIAKSMEESSGSQEPMMTRRRRY